MELDARRDAPDGVRELSDDGVVRCSRPREVDHEDFHATEKA
jgi:hypothetical protein